MTTPTELLRQAREALAYLLPLAEMQPADVEPGRHLMRGYCPDETQPSSRDAECPACKKMVAADELIAAIDALPSAPAWPCHCDERGIGKPGVTCGDCPRDYGHTVDSAPSGAPVDLTAQIMNIWCRDAGDIAREHEHSSVVYAYKCGHRDARHAAAELVGVATTAPAPLPPHNGLTVKVGADGAWLAFVASTGRSALLNVERIADSHGSITGKALRDWAADVSGTAPLMANGLTAAETSATASVAGLADWTTPTAVPQADAWRKLYRRAINEANGLTNYVEDRPELRRAERNLSAIEAEARTLADTPAPKEQQ